MTLAYTSDQLLDSAKQALSAIGYRGELLQTDYRFADPLSPSEPTRSIDVAAFAQTPLSYRSACLGLVVLPKKSYDGVDVIRQYQALGAPQILSLHLGIPVVQRWKMVAQGSPQLIERIEPEHLGKAILEHQHEWNPAQILRAKSIGFRATRAEQLDFFDIGLVPAIEGVMQQKLHDLLGQVLALCVEAYRTAHDREPDYHALFRLIFRLVAAKLLCDRHHPGGDWGNTDPARVLRDVEAFYFRKPTSGHVLEDNEVQRVAWERIRSAFLFSNISVETLAYVYENTLVSAETRRLLDVYATPPEIAEYMVQALPFETLAQEERRVFEPFAGHAPFLTASLGRLRMLLPPDVSESERHAYFVRMLSGLEIDSFAKEVAAYSLMFADYPNPDGWRIIQADAYTAPEFEAHLVEAAIVLCNPPFGDFGSAERKANLVQSSNKAVAALQRVLTHPPKMLGFVLPRVFINGQSYRQVRRELASLYGEIEVVSLPDIAFRHSNVETVLLTAHGIRLNGSRLRTSLIKKEDYQGFVHSGRPTWCTEAPPTYLEQTPSPTFWYGPEHRVLNELAHLPTLGEVAEIHRGIEYSIPFSESEDRLVSDEQKPGFVPGIVNTRQGFGPYEVGVVRYLNTSQDLMLYRAYMRPWNDPKVIANASRISADRWVIAAAVDRTGLVCYQRFHGIWPKGGLPLEVLAAVVNGPVSNAFVSTRRTSRDNQVRMLRQVPVPRFTAEQVKTIVALVRDYLLRRNEWLAAGFAAARFESLCREILWQIDGEVLKGYGLAPRLERQLLDYFEDFRRPGPVYFDRYYPPGFRPSVPWSVYLSEEFQASTAVQTLERLPVLHDSGISAVVEALTE